MNDLHDDTHDCVCCRTPAPITIDGDLDKPAWRAAVKSPRFVDMATGAPGFYDTRAATLWDDSNLYVAFWIEEPQVAATLTERDSVVFQENDVEVFIAGDDGYYEFEINALGTIYEVFFVWQDAYRRGGRFAAPEFDVVKRGALSFAGDYDRQPQSFWTGTHPRGCRWAFRDWDFPGLRAAVRVDGTINDPTVIDKGWTVEIAFPWAGMKAIVGDRALPPSVGDVWRMFFGRFQKLMVAGKEVQPHPAWCWTPHGVFDTHQPERFTRVRFA